MIAIPWIALGVVLGVLLLWLMGFLLVTDFSVPLVRDAQAYRRVLVIFPHADDEAISCGGTLHRLATAGSVVTLALLTKGERGTPDAAPDENLKAIRTREAQAVSGILQITRLVQADFEDGALCAQKPELGAFLASLIEQERPDLLITYDLAGFYWHADHIACSEVVTALRKASFPEIPLWYVTFPRLVLASARLPAHLATSTHIHAKQTLPTCKLFIGASVLPKIYAWYSYKSQRAALTKGLLRLAPIWFFLSMMLFEYYAEVTTPHG